MDYDFSFSTSFNPFHLLLAAMAVYFIFAIFKNKKIAELKAQIDLLTNSDDTPTFMIIGNDNCSMVGFKYEGKRIPDVEIKDRALFIDGKHRRNLARNSRVYNRGIGIFVDGKYVG